MLRNTLINWGAVEVSPMDFYSDLFKLGKGYLQNEFEQSGQYKANPIAYYRNEKDKNGHFRIMFEDTFEEVLEELQNADFAILNGITYFGRRNIQKHASKMYAMIFDIDGVDDITLNNFLNAAYELDEAYPVPNYIILSGHGIHLYYLFEDPIPLFPNLKLQLKQLKYALTDKMWNPYTSRDKNKQFQGINQGFRVVGGKTKKNATETKTRAFKMPFKREEYYTINELNRFVMKEYRVDSSKLFKESKLSIEKAKEQYPEWYEKVILKRDLHPVKWDISGKVKGSNPYALYDWWKERMKEATYGHRYFNIMCLAIYGVKCNVPFSMVKKDAYEFIPYMNSINQEHPFTEEDVDSALECYDDRYCTFPIDDISRISAIPIKKNRRNGRKQSVHLMGARAIQEINDKVNGTNWRDGNGRPKGSKDKKSRKNKACIVEEWRRNNPTGSKKECKENTGLSYPTIRKWW